MPELRASMGPPHLCGGEARLWGSSREDRQLQWGRRISAAESILTVEKQLQSNGLQWGRRISAAERRSITNRKAQHPRASMGPPHLCGGESPLATTLDSSSRCFNGAAASLRRRGWARTQRPDWPTASMGPPHLCGGEHRRGRGALGLRAASMGPPHLCGGEGVAGERWRTRVPGLQWGRRISAAESTAT